MSHIFISYKSQQIQHALMVRDQLQAWGYETWLDKDRLLGGDQWANQIDRALKTCRACIAIITPASIESRYVTNEWDIAIMKGKPLIPLLFEKTEPHYKYIDIQYVDFVSKPAEKAFVHLKQSLDTMPDNILAETDPYMDYLQALYERINKYLAAKLLTTLRDERNEPKPIALTSERTERAVDFLFEKREEVDPLFAIGGISDEPVLEFKNFVDAFDYYDGRILLLGEPGAGKTITLLQFARDAVIKRRLNQNAPLPILGIISTWNADQQPSIRSWLAKSYGSPHNTEKIILDGQALLLLDGMDELGADPAHPYQLESETYDPRQRFMAHLPENNRILVTCRRKDYEQIGVQIGLRGAVTLKPLSDEQFQQYLQAQPELLAFVRSDPQLQEWLDTPLLLSYFAFVYQAATLEERQRFRDLGTARLLREQVFTKYVEQRYEHEQRKQSIPLPFTLDELYMYLGHASMRNIADWKLTANVFTEQDFSLPAILKPAVWFDSLIQLNLLTPTGERRYQFVHLYLRDHFAYHFAMRHLQDPDWSIVIQAANALGKLEDDRAIDSLIDAFPKGNVYSKSTLARVLGKFKAQRAIEVLVNGFKTPDDSLKQAIADALVSIGTASIPHIVSGLYNTKSGFVARAAYILGKLNAIDILKEALMQDPLRGAAVFGLRYCSDPAVVDLLASLIADANVEVRHNAIIGIKPFKANQAVPHLIDALQDERYAKHYHRQVVRYQMSPSRWLVDQKRICDLAAEALEAIGTPEAIAAVAQWRKDQNPSV